MINNTFGEIGIPPGAGLNVWDGAKIPHDGFQVFVNGDYVGDKALLTQTESPDDLEHYLKVQGLEGFRWELVGNRMSVEADHGVEAAVKEALHVYLNTR